MFSNLPQLSISCFSHYLVFIIASSSSLSFVFPSSLPFRFNLLLSPISSSALLQFVFAFFLHPFPLLLPSPTPPPNPFSIHPTESHPSSLGWHMRCFDRKGFGGAKGRKAATPWQQRHIIGGKKHIRPSITEAHPAPPTFRVLAIATVDKLTDSISLWWCQICLLVRFRVFANFICCKFQSVIFLYHYLKLVLTVFQQIPAISDSGSMMQRVKVKVTNYF